MEEFLVELKEEMNDWEEEEFELFKGDLLKWKEENE